MKNFSLIKQFALPYKINVVFGIIFSILSVIFILILPQITQLFIDSVYSFSDTDTGNLGVLWYYIINFFGNLTTEQIVLILSIVFVFSALLKNAFSLGAKQNFFYIASEGCGDVRKACFKKLAFADKNTKTSEVFFNCTNDISDLYDIYYTIFPKMLTYPIIILLTMAFLFIINWEITLAVVVFIPIIFIFGFITNKKSIQKFTECRNRKSDMVKTSEELIFKIQEIKSYGNENWAIEKYDKYNERHSKLTKHSNYYLHKCNLALNLIKLCGLAIAIIMSAYITFNGLLSIGYFVLFISYAFMVLNYSVDLVNAFYEFGIANIGVDKLNSYLSFKSRIIENKKLECQKPEIKFENVCLTLNGKNVFKKINMLLEYGKHYAIVMPQGKGKTAFCRLLLRYLEKSKGKILFNNIEYENYSINSIRGQFAYVSQEPYIFEGSIAENIAMFDKIEKKRLELVIKVCELSELCDKFLDGYEHKLFENGANLPSQEKQKINIARALYRDAPVLLLDSVFNKFNSSFSNKLLTRILKQYNNKTVLFLCDTNEDVSKFEEKVELFEQGGEE